MTQLTRQSINPKNEQEWLALRLEDITSTEVSALFNLSPYMTEFELWHRKKNKEIVTIDMNERMEWGLVVQDSIAKKFAKDNGWTIRRMDEYIRIPELGIGSSFDFSIFKQGAEHRSKLPLSNTAIAVSKTTAGIISKECKNVFGEEDGILEIKNVDSLVLKRDWIVDGENIEAPPHIELQVQHQMFVTGRKYAFIGVLIGGNKGYLIRREPDPKIISEIERRVKLFWQSINSNLPPKPDFSRDIETISRIYGYAEPGKVLEATDKITELMAIYRKAAEEEKEAGKRKESAKGELLTLIGDAEKVIGDEFKISLGVVGPAHIEYERQGYRMFKASYKKEVAK